MTSGSWDADSALRTLDVTRRPDVFLVILDAYAGDSLLTADYGLNRVPFRQALDSLGFSPVPRYTSNYAHTFVSVSSLLNFAHVAGVDAEPTGRTRNSDLLHRLISDNRTVRLFRAAGYDIHWVPGPLFAPRTLPPAGAVIHRGSSGPFQRWWMYSSLVTTWLERVWVPGVLWAAPGHTLNLAPAVGRGLAVLPALASDGRPSFALIHVMATHFPYMYGPDCGVDPVAASKLPRRDAYATAVTCLDAQLLPVLREVVATRGDSVVMLLVGDHAPSPLTFDETGVNAPNIPRAVLESHFDATAFFYLPPALRRRLRRPAQRSEPHAGSLPGAVRRLDGARDRTPDTSRRAWRVSSTDS